MSNQQSGLVVPSTNFTPMNITRSPIKINTEHETREAVRAQILKLYPDLENRHPYLVARLTNERSQNLTALLKKKTTHFDPGTSCPNGSLCIKNEPSSRWNQLVSKILECPAQGFPTELECPLCFSKIKLRKKSDWSSHIHFDFRTFSCTWDQCKQKSFTRKADWVRHENKAHRHLEWWTCDVCGYKCYRKDNFLEHLPQHYALPKPDATRASAALQKAEERHNTTQKKAEEEACKFCGRTFKNWGMLFSHMAEHMEKIALVLHFQYQIEQGEVAGGEGGNLVMAAMEAQIHINGNPTTVRRNSKTPAQAEQDRSDTHVNGRSPPSLGEDVKDWTCQKPLRERSASEDAKIYDDQIYERKSRGPFAGNLVAQGTLINIDGEDFVEYRVLTRPSLF